jgi:PTS system nitrogen regulatory IIA component
MEIIAEKIAAAVPELETGLVYRQLIEREKLGSTAIGSGVALPHTRLPECERIVGGLFVFNEPIDFSAYDDIPVQIVFALLVPEAETDEHLATLAMLAERFQRADYRAKLTGARSSTQLYEEAVALDDGDGSTAAAEH